MDTNGLKTKKDYGTYRFIYTNGERKFHMFESREDAVNYAILEGDHLLDFEKVDYEEHKD
jgi:hypothetical protein